MSIVANWSYPTAIRFGAGRISENEMWKVFNMGIGYCLIVRPTFAEGVTAKLEAAGETVRKIGVVRKGRIGVELTA